MRFDDVKEDWTGVRLERRISSKRPAEEVACVQKRRPPCSDSPARHDEVE